MDRTIVELLYWREQYNDTVDHQDFERQKRVEKNLIHLYEQVIKQSEEFLETIKENQKMRKYQVVWIMKGKGESVEDETLFDTEKEAETYAHLEMQQMEAVKAALQGKIRIVKTFVIKEIIRREECDTQHKKSKDTTRKLKGW